MKGFVYIARFADTDFYKIGVTTRSVPMRLAALAGLGADNAQWRCVDDAYRCERMLHRHFDKCRSHGEFFFLSPRQVSEALVLLEGPPPSGYCSDHEPHPPPDVTAPMGRPPRVPGEPSTVVVQFRVTPSYRAALALLEQRSNLSVSDVVRAVLKVGLESLMSNITHRGEQTGP